MQRTLQVQLDLNAEQVQILKKTQEIYKDIFDQYAAWFKTNKTSSKVRVHTILYSKINKQYSDFPTGLHQAARDHASESIKSYNSRYPKKKWSKQPTMSLGRTMRFDQRTISLRGNLLSFSSMKKRIKTLINIPNWWKDRYTDWVFKSASIGITKNGIPFANLVFKSSQKTVEKRNSGKTVGIDRGVKNVIFTSEGVKEDSKKIRGQRRKHLYNRKTLQQKGTQNAKRRLRQQAGREERFMREVNHMISKKLADDPTVATYVLEDLTSLSKKAKSKWAKHSNKRLSDWSHSQLLMFLKYKCEANGISLEFINPAYTSKTCSQCKSRLCERVGGKFECKRCGYKAHADFNAAVNIRDKYLSPHLYVEQAQVKVPYNSNS